MKLRRRALVSAIVSRSSDIFGGVRYCMWTRIFSSWSSAYHQFHVSYHRLSIQHSLFFALQLALGFCALFWSSSRRLPPPGYAVALIAVVAAIMSIQGEMLGWQKAIWMLIISVFLRVELHIIKSDRAVAVANAAADKRKEDLAFAAVIDGQNQAFSATADTLQTVIKSGQKQFELTARRLDQSLQLVTRTLEQTKPSAYVRFTRFMFLQDEKHIWKMGLPFKAKVGFSNEGNESADELWKLGKFYIGENSDHALEAAKESFDQSWETDKQGPSFLNRGDERFAGTEHAGFSQAEMASIFSKEKVIFFFFRAEYRDRNGHWGTDVCRIMINPLAADEIQCPTVNGRSYNRSRYAISPDGSRP